MDELIGLFIEDEAANVDIYTRLFALEGLKLDCPDKLPLTVDSYYDIILEKNVDFLIIDFHLEKQVTYKGIDVLREIRKNDSTIYAVLLTNYELDDFADQFGDYDYELQKSEITSRYKDVAEKIKRACGLRKENLMYRAVEIKQKQDTETIRLLQEISSKLDEKKITEDIIMEYIRKQRWANYLSPKCKEYLRNDFSHECAYCKLQEQEVGIVGLDFFEIFKRWG